MMACSSLLGPVWCVALMDAQYVWKGRLILGKTHPASEEILEFPHYHYHQKNHNHLLESVLGSDDDKSIKE